MKKNGTKKGLKMWLAALAVFALMFVWAKTEQVYASNTVSFYEEEEWVVSKGEKYTLEENIFDEGIDTYESMQLDKNSAKFLKVNAKTGEITVRKIAPKDYKKIPKKATLTILYDGGKKKDLKIDLLAPAPKENILKISRQKNYVYQGKTGYLYTIKWNKIPYATKIEVSVPKDGGVSSKYGSVLKSMNKFLKGKIGVKGGSTTFFVRKEILENGNSTLCFDVVLYYGKVKSDWTSIRK